MKSTDIRIEDVSFSYEDFRYRTPIKFGGTALDRVTILNVEVAVRTAAGKTSRGFGSMPMGNVWSFPSKTLTYDQTLAAMKTVVERVAKITRGCTEVGHPMDLTWTLEHDYIKAANEITLPSPLRGRGEKCPPHPWPGENGSRSSAPSSAPARSMRHCTMRSARSTA